MGGVTANGGTKSAESFGICYPLDAPTRSTRFPLVVVGNLLYLCGGRTNRGKTAACYALSIYDHNSTWTIVPSLPKAFNAHSGVAVELHIWYVSEATLYDYDTTTGTTVQYAMDFTGAVYHCAVFNNGYSHMVGLGSNHDEVWVNTIAGNPSQWTKVVTLPFEMQGTSCVIVGNELYIVGGRASTFLTNSFALNLDTYVLRELANMTTPRAYAVATVLDGKPTVVAGLNTTTTYLASIEGYDNISNKWSEHEFELETARRSFGLVKL